MKHLLLIAFVLTLRIVHAQPPFTYGPLIEGGLSHTDFYNTTLKKSYILYTYKKFSIAWLDDYTKYGGEADIKTELSFEEGKAYLEDILTVGARNYLLYSQYDKSRNEIVVYVQEISADMVLLGTPLRLTAFQGASLKDPNALDDTKTTAIDVAKPESQNHFVLIRKNDGQLDMRAFSLDKGQLWSKTIALNNRKNEVYLVKDVEVAANGNVYIVGSYYFTGTNAEKFPFVVMYNPTTQQHNIHNMDSGGNENIWELGYNLQYMSDGSLVLVGLTNDSRKEILSYHVSKVNELTFALEKFASGPVDAGYNKYCRKGVFSPEFIRVQNVVLLKNGNLAFSMEINFTRNGQTGVSWFSSAAHVIALDKTGKEVWKTTVQKEQMTGDSDFVGSRMFGIGNTLYVFYNDHPDNMNLSPTTTPKETILRNWYFCTVAIDEAGKSKKLNLFNSDKKKPSSFSPRSVQKIEKNLYQFKFEVGESTQFATLEVE